MKLSFADPVLPKQGALACGVYEDGKLLGFAREVDEAADGALGRAMASSRFEGKSGQTLDLLAPAGSGLDRVLLVGLGGAEKGDRHAGEKFGATVVRKLSGVEQVAIDLDLGHPDQPGEGVYAAHVALGARLASYRFDKYKTTKKGREAPRLKQVTCLVRKPAAARKVFKPMAAVADGVDVTRDLVSEPANVLTPETFAKEASKLSKLGVEVEVLNEKDLRKIGMNALLAVGQGSARESHVVVMHWKGAAGDGNKQPVAFVGKGVCFDTGGISLKPAGGMEDMKWDMGGAGVVVGLMHALASRKAKVNAIGIIGLVENMPSATATRPGDVVTSLSGQTVEVINTDAEGRLVLCDIMTYVQDRYAPRAMVDLATLTGAVIVALGHEYAGLFSNNDELAGHLTEAGQTTGDGVWRLPLGEAYDRNLESPIADMKNVGGGRDGGSITAAQFLQRFVKDTPWAHLDIAGMTWSQKPRTTSPKGATGFGVRLLDELVARHYEG